MQGPDVRGRAQVHDVRVVGVRAVVVGLHDAVDERADVGVQARDRRGVVAADAHAQRAAGHGVRPRPRQREVVHQRAVDVQPPGRRAHGRKVQGHRARGPQRQAHVHVRVRVGAEVRGAAAGEVRGAHDQRGPETRAYLRKRVPRAQDPVDPGREVPPRVEAVLGPDPREVVVGRVFFAPEHGHDVAQVAPHREHRAHQRARGRPHTRVDVRQQPRVRETRGSAQRRDAPDPAAADDQRAVHVVVVARRRRVGDRRRRFGDDRRRFGGGNRRGFNRQFRDRVVRRWGTPWTCHTPRSQSRGTSTRRGSPTRSGCTGP